MSSQTPYSGERFDPGQANALAHYDHHSRYHFVAGALAGRGALLDVGCGLGIGASFFAKFFERVVGVDPSQEAVAGARARLGPSHLEFHTIDDFDKARADELFEVVTCLDVIEHTTEQAELVQRVRRRVSANGVAVFSTPNVRYTRAHGIDNPFHVKELTELEFFGLLQAEFPNVQRFGMVQFNGAGVLPLSGTLAGDAVLSAPRGCDERLPEAAICAFVALCSFEQVPPTRPLWLADVWCTYALELQAIVAAGAKMIDERDALILRQDQFVVELKHAIAERDLVVAQLRAQGVEARPLRYRVADQLNSALQRTPLHGAAKRVLSALTSKR